MDQPDNPRFPRLYFQTDFDVYPIADVDRVTFAAIKQRIVDLGVPLEQISVQVDQVNRTIKFYYMRPESDDEYWARVNLILFQEDERMNELKRQQEIEISWQKFLQLAERFNDRIEVLTLKRPSSNTGNLEFTRTR